MLNTGDSGVSIEDALDVLLQFVHWPEARNSAAIKERWDDGVGVAGLWRVALHQGMPTRLRDVFLQELPDSGVSNEMLSFLKESLTKEQFVRLFEREDFNPYGMRMELLKTGDSKLKEVALSSPHFRLSDDEFAAYLPVPHDSAEVRQEKLRQVHMLGLHYEGATLPQLVALSTMSNWHHEEWSTLAGENSILTPDISDRIARRVGSLLKWSEVRDESRLARWMFFAGKIASSANNHEYPDQIKGNLLAKFKVAVAPGDLWSTYTALLRLDSKRLIDIIPSLNCMFDYDAIPIQFRGQDSDADEPMNLAVEAERQLKQISKETRIMLDLASFAISRIRQDIKETRETSAQRGSTNSRGGSKAMTYLQFMGVGFLGWLLITAIQYALR